MSRTKSLDCEKNRCRVPHLRDGLIIAKVGIRAMREPLSPTSFFELIRTTLQQLQQPCPGAPSFAASPRRVGSTKFRSGTVLYLTFRKRKRRGTHLYNP